VRVGAGRQTVTVDLKDKANYVWADDTDTAKTYDFTIAQKEIPITAKDKTAHVGDKAPDLRQPVLDKDYTVDGLVEGDTLDEVKPMLSGVTLKYVDDEGNEIDPDMSQAGEATIQVTAPVPEVGNYAPKCVDGKLTISKRSSYYYAPGSDAREQSPGTGDAGMLVYGLAALGGYTGTALVLRRRKREG